MIKENIIWIENDWEIFKTEKDHNRLHEVRSGSKYIEGFDPNPHPTAYTVIKMVIENWQNWPRMINLHLSSIHALCFNVCRELNKK